MTSSDEVKSKAELQFEQDLMMARAAIKLGVGAFATGRREPTPPELEAYWRSLDTNAWKAHLELFSKELKKHKSVLIKKVLFDLQHYIKDCRKIVSSFRRSPEEVLLMIAIGQIVPSEFLSNLKNLPSNREKLDRQIHKQIKELDWLDDQALVDLDALTKRLDEPRLKKSEIEKIESDIKRIDGEIKDRKTKREALAIKLVEWKVRGNIDIAGDDGKFRLDA